MFVFSVIWCILGNKKTSLHFQFYFKIHNNIYEIINI